MVNPEAPPSEPLREQMVNSGEGQEKKAEAVADLARSTSKICRNADAVRLRIRAVGSIPTAPTSFLFHFTGVVKSARQQKAALRKYRVGRRAKTSRHGWQADSYMSVRVVRKENNLNRGQEGADSTHFDV